MTLHPEDITPLDWRALIAAHGGSSLLFADADFGTVIDRCRAGLNYLATPYSKIAVNLDGGFCAVRSDEAARQAAIWAGHCAINGVTAVSPIVQAAAIKAVDVWNALDPLDADFWMDWCCPMLMKSSAVIVPPIAGWRDSRGIWEEVVTALRVNRAVFLIKPGSEFGGFSG